MMVLWEKRYPHSGEVAELIRYKLGSHNSEKKWKGMRQPPNNRSQA